MMETWKPVVGYEGLYEVSDLGRVRSVDRIAGVTRLTQLRGKVLKPGKMKRGGYLLVALRKDGSSHSKAVHALVLEAFVGPRPPGLDCCHGDNDRTNNRLDNLRWDSRQGNVDDAVRARRHAHGDRHGGARLRGADIPHIRESTLPNRELAELYGVTIHTIRNVRKLKTWSHL